MDENKHYVLNSLWLEKLRHYVKSFYKTIYLGPPIFLLLNVMVCFSLQKGSVINFWIIYIPLTVASTAFCICLPLKAIKRYKNIVHTFELKNGEEIKLTLIDDRVLTLTQYNIKDTFFRVGNVEKASKSIVDKSEGHEYIIIPEFFTLLPTF